MLTINKILSSLLIICLISIIHSEYEVLNAFPSLSFEDPVGIHHPGDGTDRLFVVEQEGRIKVFDNEPTTTQSNIFLDIRSIVEQDPGYTEEGLLGLAFHPNYSENGYFYVNYTDYNPKRNVIARYSVSQNNPNEANHNSSFILLEVEQPYTNHNGGQMGFGPDDYLYISFGDGGSGGDPQENGQNLSTLLGSIIRIDVDNPFDDLNYGIPSDNPFINVENAYSEIYAYGLRNVWRFSWDLETGFLWGADVGQNAYEEIDIIKSGLNYGWNEMEANHCYPEGSQCESDNFEPPIWEYELYVDDVCSITGGFVYRGNSIPSLTGKYIYGDWCTGDIWAFTYFADGNHINEDIIKSNIAITSFGLDKNDELLFCGGASLYKLDEIVNGDLNDDNILNILDVVLLVNLILSQGYNSIADLNNDNILNVLDVVILIGLILDN